MTALASSSIRSPRIELDASRLLPFGPAGLRPTLFPNREQRSNEPRSSDRLWLGFRLGR